MLVEKEKKKNSKKLQAMRPRVNKGNDITGMSHCPQIAAVVFSPLLH